MMLSSMLYKQNMFFSDFTYLNHWWGGLFLVLSLWSLVWKGMSLWKSAQREDKVWFVILLVVNTLGILDILYIYLFSKEKPKKSKRK